MSLNWQEIDLILDELSLENSHIQKIKQPSFDSLIFQIYRPGERFSLNICLGQGRTRIHKTTRHLKTPDKLQRFAQFLRSRINGGKIIEVRHINKDRIILLTVLRGGEETLLWIRLWGGAANVITTERDGKILDAFYRRPKRGEVSGGSYFVEEFVQGDPSSGPDPAYTIREIGGDNSFNDKIDAWYAAIEDDSLRTSLLGKAAQAFERKRGRIETALNKLKAQHETYEEGNSHKEAGGLIMSNLYKIQTGDEWVTVENYYRDNEETTIKMDPTISPEKNAEKYFEKYRKAKKGRAVLLEETENQKSQLAYAEDEYKQAIEGSIVELENYVSHNWKQKQTKEKDKSPGLKFRSGDFTILVGRTARENDELLRRWVRGNDYWLHARDYPGGYIFIKNISGKSVPLDTLIDAGNLALFYSKGKKGGKGDLYYTRVKYLRRAKDGPTGLVLPTQEKNLSINLDSRRLDRLFQGDSGG